MLVHEVFGFVGGDRCVVLVGCFVGVLVGALVDDDVVGLNHCRFLSFVPLDNIHIKRFGGHEGREWAHHIFCANEAILWIWSSCALVL